MSIKILDCWKKILDKEFKSEYFDDIISKTKEEYSRFKCYPAGKNIFRAFDECPFKKLKVIIIGQDPYHGEKQANGLCFSVNKEIEVDFNNIAVPLSKKLKNFKLIGKIQKGKFTKISSKGDFGNNNFLDITMKNIV